MYENLNGLKSYIVTRMKDRRRMFDCDIYKYSPSEQFEKELMLRGYVKACRRIISYINEGVSMEGLKNKLETNLISSSKNSFLPVIAKGFIDAYEDVLSCIENN